MISQLSYMILLTKQTTHFNSFMYDQNANTFNDGLHKSSNIHRLIQF